LSKLLIRGGFIPSTSASPYLSVVLGLILAWFVFRTSGPVVVEAYVDAIEHPSSTAVQRIRSFRLVVIVQVILLTAVLLLVPWFSGRTLADEVKAGNPYIPRSVVGFALFGSLDVRAECVTVKKTDGNVVNQDVAPNRILFLGKGDDFLVFYQPGVGPLRLPAGDFILTSINESTCK
jgi:hypothetical protein